MRVSKVKFNTKIVALLYGMICHGIFILAGSMMFFYLFNGFSYKVLDFNLKYPNLVNFFLLVQFPFFHSFLLNKKGKSILRKFYSTNYGNKLDTTIYATLASFQLFLLFFLWQPTEFLVWKADGFMFYTMSAFYLFGWILLSLSSFQAGYKVQTGSLGWTSLFSGKKPIYPDLPKIGLFKIIRHPIYFSFCIILWFSPYFTIDKVIIASTYSLYCFFAPLLKEKRLKEIYGKQFLEYKKKTPYFFPRIF